MSEEHTYLVNILPVPDGTPRPLWSVMIPTYNCAKYLRETLASVLAQDPGPDVMQIEVVDDCSTQDDPAAVVEELGHGRVVFYQQPKNVGNTRNYQTCLERSRGKLIHLLHGDDCVRDGFYHKMQRAFEKPEIGAAFCRTINMDEHSHWHSILPLQQPESGVLSNWLERIAVKQLIRTPSVVVRRDVYEKIGAFDHRLLYLEDWEMWVRIAAHYPVWYEVEPLAVYRTRRPGSLSERSVYSGELFREIRKAIEIAHSYVSDPTVAAQLTNEARENWALLALKDARDMLAQGNTAVTTTLIQEALKCSRSLKVINSLMQFFSWAGKHWLWQTARMAVSFKS
jgi:glycosyltransferase involved in cell wall biosynthesis